MSETLTAPDFGLTALSSGIVQPRPMRKLHIDYETRGVPDLTQTGVYVYAEHPHTSALVLAWAVDDDDFQWWNILGGHPMPALLRTAFLDPEVIIVAHNASFEWVISVVVGSRQGFFDEAILAAIKPLDRWTCTAARANAVGLPRALEKVANALHLEHQKDMAGHKLMLEMCKPIGFDLEMNPVWLEDIGRIERLGTYACNDGYAERDVDDYLPDLSPFEHDVWACTERMNSRGVHVDTTMLLKLQARVGEAVTALNKKLSRLTSHCPACNSPILTSYQRNSGEPGLRCDACSWSDAFGDEKLGPPQVEKVTQAKRVVGWLKDYGIDTEDSKIGKWIIAGLLEDPDLPEIVREVLVIRRDGGKSSTSKFNTLMKRLNLDARIRGALLYCGAAATGRWSSKGIQLQNLPRGKIIKDVMAAIEAILADMPLDGIQTKFGPPMIVFSELIRPIFIAPKNQWLARGDYSQIEARVLPWLSGEMSKVEAFKAYDRGEGPDIYIVTAAAMNRVPTWEIDKDDPRRQSGKVTDLACIAEDQLVLTDQGLVPIQNVTVQMKVWDGEEWVSHEGAVYKGERDCINYNGLTATADHLVFAGSKNPIAFEKAATRRLTLDQTGVTNGPVEIQTRRRVWDLLNAGPRHRFTVSGRLVHNCGFGGSVGALFAMAKIYGMKLTQEQAEEAVSQWRDANPNTKQWWYDLENTAVRCMRAPPGQTFPVGKTGLISFRRNTTCLVMILPSGRRIVYWYARLEEVDTPWGVKKWAVTYYGEDSQKHIWRRFTAWYGIFAENCLGGDTEVLTDGGWKPLIQVQTSDRVWDGEEWVNHEGVLPKGEQPVLDFGGVRITPDHKVDIKLQWVEASATSASEASQSFSEHYRLPLRDNDSNLPARPSPDRGLRVGVPLRLREPEDHDLRVVQEPGRQILRLCNFSMESREHPPENHNPRDVQTSGFCGVAIHDRSLPVADAPSVPQLRWPRNSGLRSVAAKLRGFLGGHGANLRTWINARQAGERSRVREGQLSLDNRVGAIQEQTPKRSCGPSDRSGSGGHSFDRTVHDILPDRERMAAGTAVGCTRLPEQGSIQVYDLLNAGPRHRFTVRGSNGRPFIVSNCTQAAARDVMAYSLVLLDKRGMCPVLTVHDEAVCQMYKRMYPTAWLAAKEVLDIMLIRPPWSDGLPIAAEASADNRYTKGSKENTVSGFTKD